jgi:hypothetical protein
MKIVIFVNYSKNRNFHFEKKTFQKEGNITYFLIKLIAETIAIGHPYFKPGF